MALEFGTLTDIEKVSTTKEIDGFADPRLTTMYKFFSAIYLREPSKDFIEKILEREFITYLSEIFKEGAKILKNFAETFDGKLEQYEELVVEYNSLFNVLLEQYVAPYESAYREGLLYIHAVEVKKFYESNGFAISEDYKDLPDHVGLELEFMGHLCERGDISAQKKFFKDHLIKWIPNLCDEIIKKSESDFYKGIALALLRSFWRLRRSFWNLLHSRFAPEKYAKNNN